MKIDIWTEQLTEDCECEGCGYPLLRGTTARFLGYRDPEDLEADDIRGVFCSDACADFARQEMAQA